MHFTPPNNWRDLDVAQMQHWPNAPRRAFIGFCGVLLLALLVWFFLIPFYAQYQAAQSQTHNLQQQYQQAAQKKHAIELQKNAAKWHGVQLVANKDVTAWVSQFADSAQENGLKNLLIKVVTSKPAGAAANGTNAADKSDFPKSNAMFNHPNVGQLTVEGVGSYANLIQWLETLNEQDEILNIDELSLQAATDTDVRWQLRVLFSREVAK